MGVSWTDEQRQAIDNRGGTLLVSAAAGSGKTAVLVQRVLDRVTDPEHPCDVDSFLIVTFTKAAASEMRGKIADALTDLAAKQPQNLR
uniref:UvrD-helicase domain-containing protein n=1 Tax=Butyricicoccus sp. TaxID=2049021 RepID=UPI003D7F0A21